MSSEITTLRQVDDSRVPIVELMEQIVEDIKSGNSKYRRGIVILWDEDADSYKMKYSTTERNHLTTVAILDLARREVWKRYDM